MKIKKSFSIFCFSLTIFLFPAVAMADDSRVILDQLLTGDTPQLDSNLIKIPDDLAPGFHELRVEVLDDSGLVSTKTALFCKDLKGELHFDNICPDLLEAKKEDNSAIATYSPQDDPDGFAEIALVATAVLAAFISDRKTKSYSYLNSPKSNQPQLAELGGISSESLNSRRKNLAWGDRRKYINKRFFNSADQASLSLAKGFSAISFLITRAVLDARYLRAIFGNLSWFTIPAALATSFIGLQQIDNQALPFLLFPTIVLVCLGVIDGFAGIVGALLYLNFIFANGNFDSKEKVFTGLGVALLFASPGLILSSFRPLTRTVNDFKSFWERLSDYFLAPLLTGWTVFALINALPALSKLQLPIVDDAKQIAIYAGIAALLRLVLEDFAWYLYPVRTNMLTLEKLKPESWIKKSRSIILRIFIYWLLVEPFIGVNEYFWIGLAIVLIPQILGLDFVNLPKSKLIAQITPNGALRIALLSTLSIFTVIYLNSLNLDSKEFILSCFIFLPIPALLFSLFDSFSGDKFFDIKQSDKWKWIYRILSMLIFGLLVLIIFYQDQVFVVLNSFYNAIS